MSSLRTAPPLTIAALFVAVVGVSSSAPLIAYAAAPALAVAYWRNALAVAVLAPVATALPTPRRELRTLLTGPEGRVSIVAGVALAAHFGAWVPSVRMTTVAAATALVATQPVWQGLIARAQGRQLPRAMWWGISLAVAGAVATTGADLAGSLRAVAGDGLALLGAVAGAVYTAAGERVRATVSTLSYTTVCYSSCTVVLLAVCLAGGVPLTGYPATAWLAIGGLVLGAQLLGHSMFSYALRRVSAPTVSVLILLEVPGATLLGWWWLGQLPEPATWPGLTLLVIGVAVVIRAGYQAPPPQARAIV
ncbi:DMT family transporter [Natronosporangium hydrolyticum]|uniref:DMT family transporter n=1 Tax=Natronosporangium hydrolyticum TaxID=2811111 RepID=A0A895YD23_9ACTN|nr:DMT family transporter [Natronosporangium hydrolyticum]QSB14082.1 DMT family transporter [Natronosporangium hydrolyticum]